MKKILLSILTIGAMSALLVGGTISFFNDQEISTGNTFTAGTIEIAVDNQLHWSESFNWDDVKPGKEFDISYNITNEGENPLRLWQITKCVLNQENGVIEPEQDWYDEYNGGDAKNDIDSAIVYEMYVDGQIALSREAGITMDKIEDAYLGLVKVDKPFEAGDGDGILYPGDSVLVEQHYFMKEDTENWAQSDQMTFTIEIEARQIDAPEPLQQMSFMENKFTSGDWHALADERMGILKYDYMAPTFNYDFYGVGLENGKEYCLIYAQDPWGASKPLIASGLSDSNGVIDLTGAKNLGDLPFNTDQNYPYAAKIWLLPCDDYSGHVGWPPHNDWIFDNWPGLINYREGERPNEEIQCEDNGGNTGSNSSCTDYDGDGYYAEMSGCENEPGFLGHSDCNDGVAGDPTRPGNPNSWRVGYFYYDGDDDGYYGDGPNRRDDGMMAICYGADIPTHYYEDSLGEDCNDNNSSVNPGINEVCDNGLDDDCDGFVDCMDSNCSAETICDGVNINTITFSDMGTFLSQDPNPQYGYKYDYATNANVSFTYQTVNNGRLRGTIVATGLKPYMTYQMKFEGKPTCLYSTAGDDTLNASIGYKGRWWDYTSNANISDTYYESGSGDCISGYLVWDYITTDEFGNATKYIETANSYHVLWCSDGGCNHNNNSHLTTGIDSVHPSLNLCSPFFVSGQIERFTCNGLTLDSGNYDLKFILNEESFHQGPGTWTAVMDSNINFIIQ